MANDATSKPTPIPNENATLSSATDQQKVPPLRIVLNSAGNQKSSSATTTTAAVGSQQANTKKEKAQDAKTEGSVKVGGRVRIKLGTNKQSGGKSNGNKSTDTHARRSESVNTSNDKLIENINEDSAPSFGYLRRITRRSQRAVQSISNEDEESISSMTSADENQNTNNNQTTSDNINTQDSEQSNSATLTSGSAAAAGSNATNGSNNSEIPRRYKRRKVETSESHSIDCDNLLGSQNYRLPNQNSFELFKNIRTQVDKRLKSLSHVSPRVPFGFRDYMLSRGAYLLDGNKLGNGTSLFMNEDGGLSSMPMGKYRVLRHNRTNYSVPNTAKVPLGLPVNSPLYDLFIEQEKERYKMRMQHIKERERLTLATEQEVMRVYNQAALTAVDQAEPFSACTMLKHQEIYNYMDANGVTILSKEDAQQDQVQPDGVRTRRYQHGHISPSPPRRKTSDASETNPSDTTRKQVENITSDENQKSDNDTQRSNNSDDKEVPIDKEVISNDKKTAPGEEKPSGATTKVDNHEQSSTSNKVESGICPITPPDTSSLAKPEDDGIEDKRQDATKIEPETAKKADVLTSSVDIKTEAVSPAHLTCAVDESNLKSSDDLEKDQKSAASNQVSSETSTSAPGADLVDDQSSVEGQVVVETDETGDPGVSADAESSISMEDKRIRSKEIFLSQLQEVDDKWEKIRHDMLVRHKNEAESLHAIQKLEWEWKTKEIGACDVRTTPIIDNTLVPRLNIYSQDY